MNSTQIINGKRYVIQVEMLDPTDERYRFVVQGWHRKDIFSYSMWFSKQFIEDQIDVKNESDSLESIAMCVIENHLPELLKLQGGQVTANLQHWFIEAKQQIGKEYNEQ